MIERLCSKQERHGAACSPLWDLDKPAVLCTLFGLNAWSTPPKNFYVMIYDIKFTLILIGTLLMLAMILHDDF